MGFTCMLKISGVLYRGGTQEAIAGYADPAGVYWYSFDDY